MRAREIFCGETTCLKQRHSECITHGERGRGAGRRRQVERAGFLGHADIEMHGRGSRECRGRIARQGDHRHTEACDGCQHREDLWRLARVRQGEHDVAARNHADVAVARLGRMQEEGRAAGAGECGGDLAADVSRLAHAGDHDAPSAAQAQFAGLGERLVDATLECDKAADFSNERPLASRDQASGVGVAGPDSRGSPLGRNLHGMASYRHASREGR